MGYRFEEDGWLIPDVTITNSDQKGDDYYLASPALAIEAHVHPWGRCSL